MKIKIKKDIQKPKNRYWFAWYPIVAKDKEGDKYIVWLEQVFKTKTMDIVGYLTCTNHYIRGQHGQTTDDQRGI